MLELEIKEEIIKEEKLIRYIVNDQKDLLNDIKGRFKIFIEI